MASEEDNHDSTDSTSQPANNVKEKQSANSKKSSRLREKPDIPVMFSDSEDSLEGFGYAPAKKRKNDSESEDDWAPQKGKTGSPKKKQKTEKTPRKPRKQREKKAKEPKPKKEKPTKEKKPRGRKPKKVKEEDTNNSSEDPKDEKETEEDEADGDMDNNIDSTEESNPPAEYNAPQPAWHESELLAEMINVDRWVANNLVRLFDNENTIPFIARYRRELTCDMSPDALRQARDALDTVKSIQAKATNILKVIAKAGKLTPHLEQCIIGARSIAELDHYYAPFKSSNHRTLSEAAKQLGLEDPAIAVLEGKGFVALERFVQPITAGLKTVEEVETNVCYIIADIISKDKAVLEELRTLQKNAHSMKIESNLSRAANRVLVSKGDKKPPVKTSQKKAASEKKPVQTKDLEQGKFELYYNFSCPVQHVKPYQVLALNRGENQKVLTVKINVPDWLQNNLYRFCCNRWLSSGYQYARRRHLFEKSFADAFTRLINPLVARQVRSTLNQEAERAAIDVFASNLKNLLLTPPLRGTTIMAIDPGFTNGCKSAIVSATGSVLETEVLYINFNRPVQPGDQTAVRIKQLLTKYRCELIGIGNGKGCRETEEYLSHLIQMRYFDPLDVQYTIVSEQGASIYSCTSEATKEFPTMDRNLISAVSLARRVQDPLSEMVKVEPKHLGVGMYQHDVSEKRLNATLDEVVSECVSFVGVDVNSASSSLLRRIAGLNLRQATRIMEWRESNGPFMNRQQLKLIKGIGEKTYEQCAGFVRILPQSAGSTGLKNEGGVKNEHLKKKQGVDTNINRLDQTWIHPESYDVAYRFMEKCSVDLKNIGTPNFIADVEKTVRENGISHLSKELESHEAVVGLIAEALQKPLDHDLRSELSKPLFRRGVTTLADLKFGTVLTGRVQNVTHFGSFVDIGVGRDGLIPASKLRSVKLQFGDRVEVRVIQLEVERKRITLELVNKL